MSVYSPIYRDIAPASIRVKMRYVQRATIGQGTYFYMRANSVYDPQHALGGHAALGYDQYKNLYNRYNVDSAYITITASPTSNGTAGQSIVTLSRDKDVTPPTSLANDLEQSQSVYGVISDADAGPSVVSLRTNYNCKRDMLASRGGENTSSIMGDNPSHQMLFRFGVHPLDSTQTTAYYVNVLAIIDYWVTLSEKKDLAQSTGL